MSVVDASAARGCEQLAAMGRRPLSGCDRWHRRHDRCSRLFFQAEDGIRDLYVTGVQTCALPIFPVVHTHAEHLGWFAARVADHEGWVWDDGEIRGYMLLGDAELTHI